MAFNAPLKKKGSKKSKDHSDPSYGMPRPGLHPEIPGRCTTPQCGSEADRMDESDPALTGWVRAGVYGSADPDRVWCSGLCAAYGVALAELRVRRETADA